MKIEKLLQPRYKVILKYPKASFPVGHIYSKDHLDDGYTDEEWCEWYNKFPGVFKKLEWWEERTIEEMPKYVKDIKNGTCYKVLSNEFNGRIFHVQYEMEMYHLQRFGSHYFPITKEEYDQFINQTK